MITNSRIGEGNGVVVELAQKYTALLAQNFEKQQKELLENLYEEAKVLKKELMFFKREVSSQNIQKLINEKRREKEKERELLQNRWRQCNQSFKALQEEQKKLTNQQKENTFDVQNLRKKIDEFRSSLSQMKGKYETIQSQKQVKFLTETKQNYKSPYKIPPSSGQMKRSNTQILTKLFQTSSASFFTNKYNLTKCQPLKFNLENRINFTNATESSRFENTFLKSKERGQMMNKMSTERQSNLQQFFNNPSVRLKLFKILKKKV